ncbi:hypothetical protein [Haloplasma contractile]|uniref:Holin n=1 Tax=Haloplasma contractile SSD-17B TaxID=1033810 RepID=F7PRN1_9MOLU|nr:hypothetical protein [Haloplasma contractile]ERJ11889.1 hypothetical protein HLPCO_002129 [Haloplasma contractile SSD-17B]
MIQIYYIIALAMSITNVYKKKIDKPLVPLLAFMTVILLNVLNAWIFDGVVKDAIKDAFIVGGVTIGLFNAGDMTRKTIDKVRARRSE